MGFIKRMFQLSLSKKEIVKSKRFMAILMIPIFVIQMSSFNLFLMQTAIAEDGEIGATVESEEAKEAPAEEEPVADESVKDDPPKEEVEPVEAEVQKTEIKEEPKEDPVAIETPDIIKEIIPLI